VLYDALTAMVKKMDVFWDKIPYSLLGAYRRFGGTFFN